MIYRKNTDKCLLCNDSEATRTNSHIVPAALLNNVHGKRYYEHSFTFSSDKKNVDEYFGRSYLQENSTKIKKDKFSLDYILCDKCEKYFEKLEQVCNPLNQIFSETNKDKIRDIKIDNICIKEIQNISSCKIQLLFYSIIWRLIIEDYVRFDSFANSIISTKNKLNEILLRFRDCNSVELNKIVIDEKLFLKVITTKHENYPIGLFYDPNANNPFFFIAGKFIIYLFDATENTLSIATLLERIKNIVNDGKNKFRIIDFPKEKYDNVIYKVFNKYLNLLNPEYLGDILAVSNDKLNNSSVIGNQ